MATTSVLPVPTARVPHRPPTNSRPTANELRTLVDRLSAMVPATDARDSVTLAQIIDPYLIEITEELAPDSVVYRKLYLGELRADLGDRVIRNLTPLDLRNWFKSKRSRFKSGSTVDAIHTIIQRALNWATEMRLVHANPWKGVRINVQKKTGRALTLPEFQAILRHSDTPFKRFIIALRLCGCRPGELAALRWAQVDWNRGLAVQTDSKTKKITGKDRVIVLTPQLLKLLQIIKREQCGPAAVELRRILEYAPNRRLPARQVSGRMRQLGFSYRQIYLARNKIGAIYRRVGGYSDKGYTIYELPHLPDGFQPTDSTHVFLNGKLTPWKRRTLDHHLSRLRRRIGLPDDAKLYSIRHLFGTAAVKLGCNLKAVSVLMGHQNTVITEKNYIHVSDDFEFLHESALAALGTPSQPSPLPLPSDTAAWTAMLEKQFAKAPIKRPAAPKPAGRRPLQPSEQIAYKLFQIAVKETGARTDLAAYEWLITQPKFAVQLAPSFPAFRRQLFSARRFYHGGGKQFMRRAAILEERNAQ